MEGKTFYIMPMKSEDIYHYGIKRRSGRYPYGSGDRPYQGEDVRRLRTQNKLKERSARTDELAKENLQIGRQRLENRLRVANIEADEYARKVGWRNTEKSGEANQRMNEIKKVTNEMLASEERMRVLGDYTRRLRNVVVGGTTIGSVASYASSAAFLAGVLGAPAAETLLLPVIPAAVIGYAGYRYYQHTKY